MERRKYPQELKVQAVAIYARDGGPAAAEATGVDRATISRWASDAGVKSGHVQKTEAATAAAKASAELRRARLADALLDGALELLETLRDPTARAGARYGELAQAFGIIFDKFRLEAGAPQGSQTRAAVLSLVETIREEAEGGRPESA